MPEISATAKSRIDARSFIGHDAATPGRINHRQLSPALCLARTPIGVLVLAAIL